MRIMTILIGFIIGYVVVSFIVGFLLGLPDDDSLLGRFLMGAITIILPVFYGIKWIKKIVKEA
jgi:hypothetical protein